MVLLLHCRAQLVMLDFTSETKRSAPPRAACLLGSRFLDLHRVYGRSFASIGRATSLRFESLQDVFAAHLQVV